MNVIHQMGNVAITYVCDFLMSNVLGVRKDELLWLNNIQRFSLVHVSDAKATKNGYKILITGAKFLAFWILWKKKSTMKKYCFLTINHDFSLNYGYAEQRYKIILLTGLLWRSWTK